MTTLLISSDWHVECHWDNGRSFVKTLAEADILLLAGDITNFYNEQQAAILFRELTTKYKHVVSVNGNHCYYHSSPTQVHQIQQRIKDKLPNWHPLDKSTVTIEGLTFAGATTWFPDSPDTRLLHTGLNDFTQITDFNPWVYQENANCIDFWQTVNADVWISHHAPSNLSISERYKGNKLNCFFVDERLGDIVATKQPKLLLHGHLHDSSDYLINQTEVICNPYGYQSFSCRGINPQFNPNLIIEL